jgi:hypothetical protein
MTLLLHAAGISVTPSIFHIVWVILSTCFLLFHACTMQVVILSLYDLMVEHFTVVEPLLVLL